MSVNELILGLDLGTSSLKGVFLTEAGEIVAKYEIPLALSRSDNYVEQDAREYGLALERFVNENPQVKKLLTRVRVIGLSGHTPSLLGIDENGTPTFPVLIWQDNRAELEANQLSERFGDPRPLVGTSLPWSASGSAAKAFWISRHHSEWAQATRWLLQPKDFLGFLLTGEAISDPWSTKGLCNVRSGKPVVEVLEFAGWNPNVVPRLMNGFDSRGVTTSECESRFGIPAGIPVSVGWSDAMCGMLALGAFSQPTSFIITGTSAIVGTSSKHSPENDAPLYLIPDGSAPFPVTFGPTQMSGGSISWGAELLGLTDNQFVSLGASDSSANVPIYLPYIAGERAPLWRQDIRGSFTDISVMHGRSALARSVMEGICFAERQVLELSQKLSGTSPSEIVISGRAGNDPQWLKTRLRTMGQPIRVVDDVEITCRGSAILAHTLVTKEIVTSSQALGVSGVIHQPTLADLEYGQKNFERFLAEQRSLLEKTSKK